MTGFGKSEVVINGKTITAEIRSLNSKQLDLSIKMPLAYRPIENDIRALASKLLVRGKVEVVLSVTTTTTETAAHIDSASFKAYVEQIDAALTEADIEATNDTVVKLAMKMPNVIQSEVADASADEQSCVMQAVEGANLLLAVPGSGKTTVGKILAEKLGRKFIDTDNIIESENGDISAIFEKSGESGFRKIESDVIKRVSALQGKVIATGGGAVLKQENIDFLKLNGKVFFIDRPLEKLVVTPDRPLSSDRQSLEKRYNERYSIYCDTCDKKINSSETAEGTADIILEDFES